MKTGTDSRSPTNAGMQACAVLMAAAAVALILVYGVSWWAVAGAIVLLACPVVIVWTAWRYGRAGSKPVVPTSPKKEKP